HARPICTNPVSIKQEYVAFLLTEAVIARLSQPDFLAAARSKDSSVDAERAEVLAQIEADRAYLDDVRQKAADAGMFDLVIDQERRVRPRIEANEQRLRALSGHSEEVLALASEEDVRGAWERLDVATRRDIVRSLLVPVVKPAERGQKGLRPERVEIRWT